MPMERKSFANVECAIARATDQIGDAWSLLILRTVFLGVRCFQDLAERLAVPDSTLARKLKVLCQDGLLKKVGYQEHPPRAEYLLTEKGSDLMPVLLCLATWGNRWLSPAGAPLQPVWIDTGEPLDIVLCDARTGRQVLPGAIALTAGPGASSALRAQLTQPVVFGSLVAR